MKNISVSKLLFGLDVNPQTVPASAANPSRETAILLERINQLEQNILAGQAEQAKEMQELIQRQFTTLFRIE